MRAKEIFTEAWTAKYKRSINCSHPKGFSQKAHCAGKSKHNESVEMEMVCELCGMCQTHGNIMEIKKGAKDSNGFSKCWPGKHAEGTKKGKNGGQVRNCVPNEDINEFANSDDDRDVPSEDPYKRPKPRHYNRSIDFFGQFEADHFDHEDFDDATGVFKGYWGKDQIAYFKFDDVNRTDSDDSGMGWYYEPQNELEEDWNKVNHQDKTDGLSRKAVKAYRRENPGSKLQTAVTTKPSKLKAGSKDAKRRKSFCARMSGNKGPMKDEKGRPTPKAKALRRWNCESIEQLEQMLSESAFALATKGVQRLLPGINPASQISTTVNNLKQFQPYVQQGVKVFPSQLGGSLLPRSVPLNNGNVLYIFNRSRAMEKPGPNSKPLGSVILNPKTGEIVGKDFSRLTPQEIEYIENYIKNKLVPKSNLGPEFQSPSHISGLRENRIRDKKQQDIKNSVADNDLNYQGLDPLVRNLTVRARAEGDFKNDLEASLHLMAKQEQRMRAEIDKLESETESQSKEIKDLIARSKTDHEMLKQTNKRYNDQERRFKSLNATIASQNGQATPDQVASAKAAQQIQNYNSTSKQTYLQPTAQKPVQQPLAESWATIPQRLWPLVKTLMKAQPGKSIEDLGKQAAMIEKKSANPELYSKKQNIPTTVEKPVDIKLQQDKRIMTDREFEQEYGSAKELFKENKKPKQETPKPRNFVAKNAVQSGAGAHKDKKKADKQGDAKHKGRMMDLAEMETELDLIEKASRALCTGGTPDKDLGASNLASCKSQGLRARDGEKSHLITAGSRHVRIKVGGKKIKGRKYGGPLPDYGTRK